MEIKKVIRSNRKTISLQVSDDATLIVRAPFKVSEEIIIGYGWLKIKKLH